MSAPADDAAPVAGCSSGSTVMPLAREIASKVARAIAQEYEFDEESTSVLDYGCGTGLLSRALAPLCKTVVGADVNPSAIVRYNARVAQQGIPLSDMRAVHVDGLKNTDTFDVVACSMAYHHFTDIQSTTRALAARLIPSGALFIADALSPTPGTTARLLHLGGPIHAHAHAAGEVPHPNGFSREEIEEALTSAGLEDVRLRVVHTIEGGRGAWDIFLASGWAPDPDEKDDDDELPNQLSAIHDDDAHSS